MSRWLALALLIALLCLSAAPALALSNAEGFADTTYTVRAGDTLFSIAQKFGVSVSAIARANGVTNTNLIYVGQKLIIPTGAAGSSSSGTSGSASACETSYIVKQGETLKIIAAKCGTTVSALVAANNIANRNLIFAGQRLIIPSSATAPIFATTPALAPTMTPTPSVSSAPVTTTHGITGTLTLCNPEKPSFAAGIERICFRELIVNNTSAPVSYGVIGVQATDLSTGATQFQTSWSGDLSIGAGCAGPKDTCGGEWEDGIYISTAGTYRLALAICYANTGTCFLGTGWEVLTAGVNVNVVIWNP